MLPTIPNGQQDVAIRYKMQSGDSMRKGQNPEAEEQIFEMQVRICKAFANSTRLRMLDLLAKRE